jgi:hypothetical protein
VSFGITVELLMLSSDAIVGGLYISAKSSGARRSFVTGRHWSGSLVLELRAVAPFLCAVPVLFHELAHRDGPGAFPASRHGS